MNISCAYLSHNSKVLGHPFNKRSNYVADRRRQQGSNEIDAHGLLPEFLTKQRKSESAK